MQVYADADALIDDRRVLAVAVVDNGEPFVDARELPAIAVDESRADVQQLSGDPFHVRSGVAERLARAQGCLPDQYRLQLKEAWRPVWVQQRLWQANLDELRASRPGLTDDELHQENARLVAPADGTPPHSTGGAVDVILLHENEPTDMGWGFNQPGMGSHTAYSASEPARRNRALLVRAMDAAGCINYPQEWWHWSYGDPGRLQDRCFRRVTRFPAS